MRIYDIHWLKTAVAAKLKMASVFGEFYGRMHEADRRYMESCTAFHASSGSVIIFTRDTGHHSSGWFKNPDYERCLHLSLSFREPFELSKPRQHDRKLADEWCELFFEEHRKMAWKESAKTADGQSLEVVHWRVFCDDHYQPIKPRGEVYSLDFTEKGWQSWGELHPEDPAEPSILHAG